MSPRLIIAAQTGLLAGLVALAFYQARQLHQAYRQLELASLPPPPLGDSTNSQRPLRLRLQSLPPIQIRTEVHQLDWAAIESDDYHTYVANLRAIGCPETTLRDIIVADVNQLFAERRRAVRTAASDWEFWRHPDEQTHPETLSDEERLRQTQLAGLERERRLLLNELLGPAAAEARLADYTNDMLENRALQFLDPAKRDAVARALARWRFSLDESDVLGDPESQQRARREADRALAEALGQTLTPAEREQYELRNSPLADELRSRLRGFAATKEEFEQLFRLEREFEQDRVRLAADAASRNDPFVDDWIEASHAEQEERARQLLGPQRYADYVRSQDADFQTLFSLARDHDVPTTVANDVWAMRREVERQTGNIRQNPLLTADQKILALEAIQRETLASIVDVLGEPLVRDYQREGGGWLVDLTAPVDLGETGYEIIPPPLPELPNPIPQEARTVPLP